MRHPPIARRACLNLLALGGTAALCRPATGRAAARWPNGAAGAVSITYDDGLDSHLDIAVPALRRHGLTASFYVTLDNIRHRLGDWRRLPSLGHELGNHSVHHPCDLVALRPEDYAAHEIAPLEAWLDQAAGRSRVPTFAYPCDVTDLGPGSPNREARHFAEMLRRNGIRAARTSEGVFNSVHSARRRPYRLQALAVGYDAVSLDQIADQLELAARHGLWAILVLHGIGTADGGAITERFHERLLDMLARAPLWTAPLGHVFEHIAARR